MLIAIFMVVSMTSCYQQRQRVKTPFEYTERQLDSLSFFSSHHYTNNYNFVVTADSLVLLRSLPEEMMSGMQTDSFTVYRGAHLVVADIRQYSTEATEQIAEDGTAVLSDPVALAYDTVWVELANDTSAFGWAREGILLKSAQPDDPISAFISAFSDNHTIIFFGFIGFFAAIYLLRSLTRRKAYIVHLNDIPSFYPTLLSLLVAFSASLYAAIQTFVPEMWQHFYFHPTLNPFSVPMPLDLFLGLVWTMIIVAFATAEDVRRQLPTTDAILYLGSLAAVCALNYIVFSITSLYFVGYLLLAVYAYYALRQYLRHSRAIYQCGRCGAILQKKGRCPHCGAINE